MNQQLIENRYKIIQPLGSGGFGETFLAEDAHMPSGRRCVIKRLKPVTNDPKVYQLVQERFSREAAILEDLGANHAQIPTLYAYFESENLFYLVQEWIQGETLTAKVQQSSKLSESSVKAILVEILPVLEYVHSKGIVHRDIKPDNILLRQADAKPVLIDFGAVKETMGTVMSNSGNESRSIVIGTPGFMPSEQAVGRPVFASDLYSLGLTAIYLLAGKSPQDLTTDPTTGEILWRQFAPTVTPTLAGILDKAIHPSARDRYHSARAMLDDLQRGQVPIAPGVVPPSIPPTVRSEAPPVAPVYPPPTYPTYPPPPAPTVVSGTPGVAIAKGLADWQKAVITGGIIGLFVVGAIFATRSPVTPVADETETSEATVSSSDNTTTAASPDSSNVVESNQSSTSQSSVQEQPYNPPVQQTPYNPPPATTDNPPPSSISENDAVNVLRQWQQYKGQIFAPPYQRSLGAEVLTGQAFRDNIRKTDGTESSVDWLQNNNAYYSYGVQQIERVDNFVASGDRATIDVVITEQRTLYKDGKVMRDGNTAFDTRLVRYNLELDGGRLKISDYNTVQVLEKR